MVSMETIKMKSKGVQCSWLRGANLFIAIGVWGSRDFVCLAWLWSEGNLLQAAGGLLCKVCVCPFQPWLGPTSASHVDRATWILHVMWPARDPSCIHMGSWCDSGQPVFHGNFLLIKKHPLLPHLGIIKSHETRKLAKVEGKVSGYFC